MKKSIHIVPHEAGWAVRFAGADEPDSLHDTQQAAIENAMDLAQDEEVDIVIHRSDGTFRNILSYETIARRAEERAEARSRLTKQIVWSIFAAGAATAVAIYFVLHPPSPARRRFWN